MNWGFSVLKFFWDNFLKSALVLPLQENLQPSSSHSIMAASALYFLSLVFTQFVNIKTQFCSSNLFFFKDTKFSMHKLVWNRMEFPIQQKREECFRNQNSLLPVFLLQHKDHVHTSLPIPRKKEERPWILPFWWSGMMERICCCSLGNLLWKVCQSTLPF